MQPKTFNEEVFFSTARIQVPYKDAAGTNKLSIGTGFFLQAKVDTERCVHLLVSNKHVFLGKGQRAVIHIHQATGSGDTKQPLLHSTTPLTIILSEGYFEHPDPSVDLACVNVSGVANDDLNFFLKALSFDNMVPTFEEEWIAAGSQVRFIGYPDGRFDSTNNLPILRTGTISTIPRIDYEGKKQFLVDAHVHPGSSGSPVFAVPPLYSGEKYKFLGVMTMTMVKEHELQTLANVSIAARPTLGVKTPIGLGLVLKPVLIKELINEVVLSIPKDQVDAINADEPTPAAEDAVKVAS